MARLVCRFSVVAIAALAVAPVAALASNRLSVVPFPGTPDASASSEIVFSALSPSEIKALGVLGSRSGLHAGHLSALPDGAGSAFVADKPFTPGEVVHVTAMLGSARDGTASGDPGSMTLAWSFTVAVKEPAAGATAVDHGPRGSIGASQSFHSDPALHPVDDVVTHDADPDAGDIFLTPRHGFQDGPMIVDPQGKLVWFEPLREPAYNLEVQRYRGEPVLTWFQGSWLKGGEYVIANQSYRTVAIVHTGEGYASDLHEFQITRRGTALVDSYSPVRADLSTVGGPASGTVLDCIVQEIDIRSGRVLWEWHALGHVPLSDSHTATPHSPHVADDFFHLNAIQQLPDGNFLVSARNTWAVYEISRRTGDVLWTLGGKHSSFKMGPGTNFEWQHDAHLYPGGLMTLFDDAGSPTEERQSSAKVLTVNTRAMRVSLLHRYTHSPSLLASLAGSVQALADRNLFVGWGSQPVFSEVTPGGRTLLEGRLAFGAYSYRAYRFPWIGHPLTKPALAVSARGSDRTVLYASWNGATHVAFWQPLGGSSPEKLKPIGGRARRSGFETTIRRRGRASYYAVRAIGPHGRVLGISRPQKRWARR